MRHPEQLRVVDDARRIACLPPGAWPTYDFTGKRVLSLLPSHALGDNVPVLTFLQALAEKFGPREIGVFCTGPTHDIYLTSPLVTGRRGGLASAHAPACPVPPGHEHVLRPERHGGRLRRACAPSLRVGRSAG